LIGIDGVYFRSVLAEGFGDDVSGDGRSGNEYFLITKLAAEFG